MPLFYGHKFYDLKLEVQGDFMLLLGSNGVFIPIVSPMTLFGIN